MSLRDRLNKKKGLSSASLPGGALPGKSMPAAKPSDSRAAVPEAKLSKGERFEELKTKVHTKLVDNLSLGPQDSFDFSEIQAVTQQFLEEILELENIPMSRPERAVLIAEVAQEVVGNGPIEPLLHDETISEIMINGPHSVFIERNGKLEVTDVKFKDNDHLMHIIERIVSSVGRRVDEKVPMVDARLKAPGRPYDGSRFNAIIPPLAIDGASVTIRKFKQDAGTLEKLLGWGSMTPAMAELLRVAIKVHLNVVISGGTGSGKTTMLNSLSALISGDERIVTMEDAAELQLQQEHVIRLESRPANIEGEGAVPIRKLLINALRMRPDRIIVGECRGGETLDMLQAMNTGHDGSLTTLHANRPRDALARIETMCLMNDNPLPERAIKQQVSAAIHLIVQVSRLPDGQRKTTSITEIVGMEGDIITMQEIFKYDKIGIDEDGKILGAHVATGIRPQFLERARTQGIVMDEAMFTKQTVEEVLGITKPPAGSVPASPQPKAPASAAPPRGAGIEESASEGSLRDLLRKREGP